MARKKNPRLLVALALAAIASGAYSVYSRLYAEEEPSDHTYQAVNKKYAGKRIALTLSWSVLNSNLPLHDMLVSTDKVVFILPPDIETADLTNELNAKLLSEKNYKLLQCENTQGYIHTVRNLKPDLLLVCPDDLGMPKSTLHGNFARFVREIVCFENAHDLYDKVNKVFV